MFTLVIMLLLLLVLILTLIEEQPGSDPSFDSLSHLCTCTHLYARHARVHVYMCTCVYVRIYACTRTVSKLMYK